MMSTSVSPTSSSDTLDKPSRRKGNKKVRTGCYTCKIRKVKCDETRPHCDRCTKTGRKCDGYPPPRAPASSRCSSSSNSSNSGNSSSARRRPSPSLEVIPGLGSDRERRAFRFYKDRCAAALSCHVSEGFWDGVVLKVALSEPAVRHSVLALSSMHEMVNMPGGSAEKSASWRFAIQQYGRAIRDVSCWVPARSDEPAAIPLLVCVIFICIELLAHHEGAAQLHISQGRRILSQLPHSSRATPALDMIKCELVPIYTRLSLASFLYGRRPAPIPRHLKAASGVPDVFAGVEDARRMLYQVIDEILTLSTSAHEYIFADNVDGDEFRALCSEQRRLLTQLSQWHSALSLLLITRRESSPSPPPPPKNPAHAQLAENYLMLYYHASLVWTSICLSRLETCFDEHTGSFAAIILHASHIIHARDSGGAQAEAFTFESEVAAPLYWVATKCRHPSMRRAALRLLMTPQVMRRREQLWVTGGLVALAARVIELEEGGLGDVDNSIEQDYGGDQAQRTIPVNNDMPSGRPSHFRSYTGPLNIPVSEYPAHPFQPPETLVMEAASFLSAAPSEPPGTFLLDDGGGDDDDGSPRPTPAPSPIIQEPRGDHARSRPVVIAASTGTGVHEPPYGLEEKQRVKNINVGLANSGAVGVTLFLEPENGRTEWKVLREVLDLYVLGQG